MPDFASLKELSPWLILGLGIIWLLVKLSENTAITNALGKRIEGSTPDVVAKAINDLQANCATKDDQLFIKSKVELLEGQFGDLREQVDALQQVACANKDCPNRKTV